ncbi:MAG: hypothetical protein ACRDPW_08990, partial [Mycobacteriales bacterium]
VKVFGDDIRGERAPGEPDGKNLRRAMDLRNDYDRITRFYYYKFLNDDGFDSGATATNGTARCLYYVYRYNSNPGAGSPPTPPECPSGASPSAP